MALDISTFFVTYFLEMLLISLTKYYHMNFFKPLLTIAVCIPFTLAAQDWENIPVPAKAGSGKVWELQEAASDDFNYIFEATKDSTDFGDKKWYNFYHNGWDGPGTTYWQYDHVSVDGSDLVFNSSRNKSTVKMGVEGINAGCVTGTSRVKYPVFVEASISVADISLASDVWLLSPDDTQEIDIIECYGGADNGNQFFAQFIHLSHHSFIRVPFTDYQPRDANSWWGREGVSSWGEYLWNDGDRKYVQTGVYWISPFHFEYYIDGKLVRVVYNNAFATYKDKENEWSYTYPTMTDGELDFTNGYQTVVEYSKGSTYSFQTLKEASDLSEVEVIDPFKYQSGNGFFKEMDIIINVESQNWHVAAGRTPTNAELNDPSKNIMKVDWLRVYKPVEGTVVGLENDLQEQAIPTIYPIPVNNTLFLEDVATDRYDIITYDLQGQVIDKKQQLFIDGKYRHNTESLSEGVYLLKLVSEKVTHSLKFVVNR